MLDLVISSYPQNNTKPFVISPLLLPYSPRNPTAPVNKLRVSQSLQIPSKHPRLKQSERERKSRMRTLTSTSSFLNPPTLSTPSKSHNPSIFSLSPSRIPSQRKTTAVSCNVALKQDSATATTSSSQESEDPNAARIGSKVKVKVPLKVYHVPKVPEIDLMGMEGTIKQHIWLWKGKRISANLPFKVEFLAKVEGRDQPVKFVAHLNEDEFDYLD